jgi:hypothetical protein
MLSFIKIFLLSFHNNLSVLEYLCESPYRISLPLFSCEKIKSQKMIEDVDSDEFGILTVKSDYSFSRYFFSNNLFTYSSVDNSRLLSLFNYYLRPPIFDLPKLSDEFNFPFFFFILFGFKHFLLDLMILFLFLK